MRCIETIICDNICDIDISFFFVRAVKFSGVGGGMMADLAFSAADFFPLICMHKSLFGNPRKPGSDG